MNINDRVARCHLVAKVLMADSVMTSEEKVFLDELMERLELSQEERELALSPLNEFDVEQAALQLSQDELRELMLELFSASRSDGSVNKYESHLVRRICRSLRDGKRPR